jgi:polyhydroxyalkanoate synthesis regulator phasin
MKRTIKVLFFIGFVAFSFASQGQETFTFRYLMEEMDEIQDINELKKHQLGDEIARKFLLLKESYTYKDWNELQRTESTIIEKPSIYNSCKKVSKHLVKSVKKGEISEDEARDQMNKVLDIALNIRYQETEKMEDLLWDLKKPDQLITFYSEKVKLEM